MATKQSSQNPLRFVISAGLARTVNLSIPFFDDHNIRFMREAQEEAFDAVYNSPFSWLGMPMGSGKSSVATFVIGQNLKDDPRLKVIIAVPQLTIAKSFRHQDRGKYTKFFYSKPSARLSEEGVKKWMKTVPASKYCEWAINNDLTKSDRLNISGTVKSLIAFLDSHGTSPSQRILLCTHATLVAAFRKLKQDGKSDLMRRIKFIIDEAHHVSDDDQHGLGEVAKWVFGNYERLNLQMLLMTATPFRGDFNRIIPEDYGSLFDDGTYLLPFDKYMRQMKFLRSFDYGFACYNQDKGTAEPLANCLADGKYSKTLIFLPRRTPGENSLFPSRNKAKEVDEMLLGIVRSFGWKGAVQKRCKVVNGEIIDLTALFEVRVGKDEWKTVVDLVEDDGSIRKQVKKYLDTINDDCEFADYIISLEIGKEGFDWQWCDQVIIFGKVGSLTQLVQTSGRPLRDVKGKPQARIRQFLPVCGDILADKDSLPDHLNDVFNAVCLSMLMYDFMEPLTVQVKEKGSSRAASVYGADLIARVFPKEQDRYDFYCRVESEIEYAVNEAHKNITIKERAAIIAGVMEEFGASETDIDFYAETFAKYLKRRNDRMASPCIEAMKGNPILEELRKSFGHASVAGIPAEACIAAWTASQIGAPTLASYHRSMERMLGLDSEKEERIKGEQLLQFMTEQKELGATSKKAFASLEKAHPDLHAWILLRRRHPYHRARRKELKNAK